MGWGEINSGKRQRKEGGGPTTKDKDRERGDADADGANHNDAEICSLTRPDEGEVRSATKL